MEISPDEFKKAMGHFASGVTIVTYSNSGELGGLTASSFTSVSLNPPLILVNVNKTAISAEKIDQAKSFGVNILSSEQEEISNQFASQKTDKKSLLEKLNYETKITGSPLIPGSLVKLDCTLENKFEGGDHWILVGRVVFGETDDTKRPVLYFNRAYYKI